MRRIIRIIIILFLVTSLTSCIAVGSGGEKIQNHPTIGQQLIDLQKAKDEGAITAKEYGVSFRRRVIKDQEILKYARLEYKKVN